MEPIFTDSFIIDSQYQDSAGVMMLRQKGSRLLSSGKEFSPGA